MLYVHIDNDPLLHMYKSAKAEDNIHIILKFGKFTLVAHIRALFRLFLVYLYMYGCYHRAI